MPLGGHAAAANVYTNGKDTVSLLLSSAEAWNEGSGLYKLGIVNVRYTPAPDPSHFRQTLDLGTATVLFEIGSLRVAVWTDADSGATLVSHDSADDAVSYVAEWSVEAARPSESTEEDPCNCGPYAVSADVVKTVEGGHTLFYHRNEAGFHGQSYFNDTCREQNLGAAARASLPDVLLNRTSGAVVSRAVSGGGVLVTVLTAQTASAETFIARLTASIAAPSKALHDAWWRRLWSASHMELRGQPRDATISQKMLLQRYLNACQGRASVPIKSNGMLFTAEKPPHTDYRRMGSRNAWRSTRLPYYSMFASGDFDMLHSFLASFQRTLPLAKARAAAYYNVSGAFWPEETDALFGTACSTAYGCARNASHPRWWSSSDSNRYNLQGSLDLSLFALDYHAYTGDASFLGIAAEVVQFYMGLHAADADTGKVMVYPSQALATWLCPGYPPLAGDCVKNDMPTVAGMTAVVSKLLQTAYGTAAQRRLWRAFAAALPVVPRGRKVGVAEPVLLPCEVCPDEAAGTENPELYAVHPYRLYTEARERLAGIDATAAKLADSYRRFKGDAGWEQSFLNAALLGMSIEARTQAEQRAATPPAAGYRFPGFVSAAQGFAPSAPEFSNLANGVTYMLVQTDETAAHRVLLLPCWPCSWEVDFKIHVPRNTTITGNLTGGTIRYTVDPPERAADVTAADCQM